MDFRPVEELDGSDEALLEHPFKPFYNFFSVKPAIVKQCVCSKASYNTSSFPKYICRDNSYDRTVFKERPLLGPLLFDNNASDARDHAANERSMPHTTDPKSENQSSNAS